MLWLLLSGTAFNTRLSAEDTLVWRRIGPGGGGGTLNVTIDPHDAEHVICNSDMTGGYVTFDGGERWQMFNLWSVPADFAFVPGVKGRVYASSRGYLYGHDRGGSISMLYRSDDGGMTWAVVFPNIPEGFDFRNMQSDQRHPSEILPGAIDGSIEELIVDPNQPDRIVIGCSSLKPYIDPDRSLSQQGAFILISHDGGRTVAQKTAVAGKRIHALSILSTKGNIIAITDRCAAHITNVGRVIEYDLPTGDIIDAAIAHTGAETVLYILSPIEMRGQTIKGGLLASTDLGKTWQNANGNLPVASNTGQPRIIMNALGASFNNPSILYLSATTLDPGQGREPLYSIYRSMDGGGHWKVSIATSAGGKINGDYEGGWLDEAYDPGWPGSPRSLAVAPSDQMICYATDNGRIYRTRAGGASWEQVYTEKASNGAYRTTGIDVTTTYGVHFDPFHPERFMVSFTDVGLFRTEDNGATFHHAIKGIPKNWRNTCYWAAYDPEIPGRVYSAWGRIHDLPRGKMLRRTGVFEWAPGGVAISENGGLEWRASTQGLPRNALCTHILVDEESSSSERILYVCVFGKGVFKTRDGGWSWTKASEGIGPNRFVWEIEQTAAGKLYLLVVGTAVGDNPLKGAVYVSGDQAKTWQPVALPKGVQYPSDITGDPLDGETIYLTAWPDSKSGKDRFGGTYKTVDGGKTWSLIFNDAIRCNGIAVNPKNRNILVINTFHNAAYISQNEGRSWSLLHGYDFKWGQKAFFHPERPRQVFLTTYGASVFTTWLP